MMILHSFGYYQADKNNYLSRYSNPNSKSSILFKKKLRIPQKYMKFEVFILKEQIYFFL